MNPVSLIQDLQSKRLLAVLQTISKDVASASIDTVVMDPPYYNNVMYAELSDFFYVWLKRTAGNYILIYSRECSPTRT